MQLSRLAALPRLAHKALSRLLDIRAAIVCPIAIPVVSGGETVYWLDEAVWRHDRVTVFGRTVRASTVLRHASGAKARFALNTANDKGAHDPGAFHVDLLRSGQNLPLTLDLGERTIDLPCIRLSPPPRSAVRRARLRQLPSALAHAAGHWREIAKFIGSGDPGVSVALRDAFGFGDEAHRAAPLVSDDLFGGAASAHRHDTRPVVILVPVYNARPHVARLLRRLATGIEVPHHILLVDDASDDPEIAPLLREFAASRDGRATVETLPSNQGFVAAVNRGLTLARRLGHHVILLNSDALPPESGWAGRLLAPILTDRDVASVTPVSNTAEIASIPAQGVETRLSESLVDTVDAVADTFGDAWRHVDLPTGIGFAMAMNRRFLDKLGGFDQAFGRGYGEEVDWCQRARAAGGRNVLATSVFVGHEGGASFGGEKARRIRDAGRIIGARYPDYDRDVRDWTLAAPHAVQRTALTIAWLDATSNAAVPVFMAHALGGGAEAALRREIDDLLADGAPGVVVLRAGGVAPWRIEVKGSNFQHACRVRDTRQLQRFLSPLRSRRVIYSCGVGARDPKDVPKTLDALSNRGEHRLEIRLHDYFPLSPSYCLLDRDGRYRGVPPDDDLAEWRALWSAPLLRAAEITAFSRASAAVFLEAYPLAAPALRIRPHPPQPEMPRQAAEQGEAIGVLGAINQAKGADVVQRLARHYEARRSNRRIVIVGDLDPNYTLQAPHCVTGTYGRSEITSLAERNGIGIWLIPSVWPETYSFTTREALATGLPVLTFALGAQAEAAREAANGVVLSTPPGDTPALAREIEKHLAARFHSCSVTRSRSAS